MTVSSMGVALRQIIPQIVSKKVTSYFELIKPLIEFNFENVQSRSNNMFELATQEEINKLTAGGTSNSSSVAKFTDEIGMCLRFYGNMGCRVFKRGIQNQIDF